jgi:nucleotide-binding universal stress UspA family protein
VAPALTVSPLDTRVRLERALCAVTFSPSARRAVAWAASLAAANDGEVRMFHVVPNADQRASAPSEADSERVLNRLFAIAQHLPGRPRISAAVTEGEAASEILRHARLMRADLIVVGMHALDGRVSPLGTRLAIDARCPVLVVGEGSTGSTTGDALQRILVAVNFLPASLAAADYALALARRAGAAVTVVHVLPDRWDGPSRHDPNADETRRLVEGHFRRLLQMAVSTASGTSRHRSDVVLGGRPCVEIARIAAAGNADLIVMGIDAAPTSPDAFGATTRCVMEFARSTVLLVPERLFAAPRRDRREHR